MGWFITQSLLFIIIAAIVFFLIGLWVGWILWGRRAKAPGRHIAETAEKKAAPDTTDAARDTASGTATTSDDPGLASSPADSPAGGTPSVATTLAVPSGDTEDATDVNAGDDVTTPETGPESDRDAAAVVPPAGSGGAAASEPSEIDDENLAVYAGAEKDVVAEAEAATREAADAGTATDTAAVTDATTTDAPAETGTATEAKTDAAADAEASTAAAVTPAAEPDDLTRIEGIGPKIAKALQDAGYGSYEKVAGASEDDLRAALAASGIKFAPAAMSFAAQAQYLAEGDEEGLAEYQDYLIAGRDRKSAEFVEEVDYTDVDDVDGAAARQAALEADAEKVAEATGGDVDAEAVAADAAVAAEAGTATDEAPAAVVAPAPEKPADEDLKVIEGIGPKIEKALKADGITSYAQVAALDEAGLREAIGKSGIRFAPSVSSWAPQAEYLVNGDEEGLKEYQDYLIGGQDRGRTKFVEEVDYTDVDEIDDEAARQAALEADARKVAEAEGGRA